MVRLDNMGPTWSHTEQLKTSFQHDIGKNVDRGQKVKQKCTLKFTVKRTLLDGCAVAKSAKFTRPRLVT